MPLFSFPFSSSHVHAQRSDCLNTLGSGTSIRHRPLCTLVTSLLSLVTYIGRSYYCHALGSERAKPTWEPTSNPTGRHVVAPIVAIYIDSLAKVVVAIPVEMQKSCSRWTKKKKEKRKSKREMQHSIYNQIARDICIRRTCSTRSFHEYRYKAPRGPEEEEEGGEEEKAHMYSR